MPNLKKSMKKTSYIYLYFKHSLQNLKYILKHLSSNVESLEVHDINLEKLQNMDYTNISEGKGSLEYLLYILICNDKVDIDSMYDGNELMAKIVDVVHSMTDDFDKRFYYDEEEVKLLEYQASMENGSEQRTIEIAKTMLNESCNVEFISKITNLSIEDIQKLKEELK